MPYNIVHYYLVMDKTCYCSLFMKWFFSQCIQKQKYCKKGQKIFKRHIIGMEGRRKQQSLWGPLTLPHNEIWKIKKVFFESNEGAKGFLWQYEPKP